MCVSKPQEDRQEFGAELSFLLGSFSPGLRSVPKPVYLIVFLGWEKLFKSSKVRKGRLKWSRFVKANLQQRKSQELFFFLKEIGQRFKL